MLLIPRNVAIYGNVIHHSYNNTTIQPSRSDHYPHWLKLFSLVLRIELLMKVMIR